MTILERAAQARGAAMGALADRPRDRRCAEIRGALVESRAVTRHPIEVRDASSGDGLNFTGYASVTEAPYEMYDFFGPYTEIVTAGAFAASLALPDLDVPLVLNHDSLRRIARTTNGSLTLAEDEVGLRADAPNLDPADADVAYIAPKLRSGLIDEMSFRFSIDSGIWSPDYTEFRINVANIQRGDVAIVGYGASPHTSAQLRSLTSKLQTGRSLDPEDVNMLTQALGWFTTLDSIVDEAQEALAGYLKVPNPDAMDMGDMAEMSKVALDVLRSRDLEIRKELQRRGESPSMSFAELLRISA
jgi:HK97 family phage prohead protease